MADDIAYEIVVSETHPQVTVTEPTNEITVDADDPGLVSIAIAGVATSHTSLLAVWAHPDTLSVREGQGKFFFPVVGTILGVSATVGVAPVGSDIVIDIHRGGPSTPDESIFTNQANRPRILDGMDYVAEVSNMDITSTSVNEWLRADIDEIGSTTPGANLTVTVRYRIS